MNFKCYTEVLGAFLRLGCTILYETSDHVFLCPDKLPVIQALPKIDNVPISVQYAMLTALGFDEDTYELALDAIN